MEKNEVAGPVEPTNPLEDSSVTMIDVLEQEKQLEEEYAAVLGASDEKCCTYGNGSINRQALYSCLTCCPDSSDLRKCAGICLACSLSCHENHELVELYTKRNFRCDCPTARFGENRCVLNPTLKESMPRNEGNIYNQNFEGLYCKCRRPYPDPERITDEVMLQCTICEDWFHLAHLDVPAVATKLIDTCSEMICDTCMDQHDFIRDYSGLALKTLEEEDEFAENISVTDEVSHVGEDNDNKLKSDLDKSISDIMNMSEARAMQSSSAKVTTNEEAEEPVAKQRKLNPEFENDNEKQMGQQQLKNKQDMKKCIRPARPKDFERGATFWGNDWRTSLCQCCDCLKLYESHKIEFLIDAEDPAKTYEERGMKRAAGENSSYEQGIRALASIGHVQQIDAITEYNRMKDKLKEFLQTFAINKKVVTEDDINRFFSEMRNERNANLGQPFFCR